MDTKQVIVIRKDLKMRRGKEIAQGAHASIAFLRNRLMQSDWRYALYSLKPEVGEWLNGSQTKITLQVGSEQELLDVFQKAEQSGLEVHLITDSGFTEFNGVPTNTCIAIGPDVSEKIDLVTKHLQLY